MTVYQDIRRNRRRILIGVVLGYGMSLAVLVIRLINTGAESGEVLGSIALATSAAIAPSLAWLSLDRRPGLLPAAALASLMTGLVTLVLLPVAFVVSLIWMQAWSSRPVKVEISRGQWWSGVALGMSAAIAVFVLFVHPDPVCTETLSDGAVVEACSSDSIVWGEALASLIVSLGAIGVAARWWPLNARHSVEESLDVGTASRDLT
jgi:uncharacterized membrane protein